jgi:hypothetical protein
MSKRNPQSEETVRSRNKQWDGQAELEKYHPYLTVRDVPSEGRSTMVLGLKTDRIHHLFSDGENYRLLLCEFALTVRDIREQYALLPWEEPQEIADRAGIRYPVHPGRKRIPIVMTSDLVLTFDTSGGKQYGVLCVKPFTKVDPANPKTTRTREKLLIEKTYWERRGIPWRLTTERDLPVMRVRNIEMIRYCMMARELDWLSESMPDFLELFGRHWTAESTFWSILDSVSRCMGLDHGQCFNLFGRAVWLRLLPVDMDAEPIRYKRPLRRLGSGQNGGGRS